MAGTDKADLGWGIERCPKFIEFKLFWEGHVNRGDLVDAFGISVNHVSTDLNRYLGMSVRKALLYHTLNRLGFDTDPEGLAVLGTATLLGPQDGQRLEQSAGQAAAPKSTPGCCKRSGKPPPATTLPRPLTSS